MAQSKLVDASEVRNSVLFLSNDDYCCGRFCEELFNQSAAKRGLDWASTSRALRASVGLNHRYPMSPIAIDFLRRRRVAAANALRSPLGVTSLDFQLSSVIVALDSTSHRPVIDEAWPQYSSWVRYWDGGLLSPPPWAGVFGRLDAQVTALVLQLSATGAFFDAA